MTWNAIPVINMGGGTQVVTGTKGTTTYNNGTGMATLTCTPACTDGSTFTLAYDAVVPYGDPSGFGNVSYGLRMSGTIQFPINTPPTANGSSISAQTNTQGSWTPNVVDPDPGQTLTCTIVTNATHGIATVASINSCTAAGTYTPTTGYTGPDSFTYKANDGIADSKTAATVTVNVSAAPPPTANPDTLTVTGATAASVNVLLNDTKGTYNIVKSSVVIATPATHGTAKANTDGTVTYTATPGFTGRDSFTYTVSDDQTPTPQVSNAATVSVTVQAAQPSSSGGALAPGALAASVGNTTGGGLTVTQVGADSGVVQQCVGGCFDFAVSGLTAGATATVVLPLSTAIPTSPVYRKLIAGKWVDFNTTAGTLASAPALSPGVCPDPSSANYTANLTAGNSCIRVTIVDGGVNDADGANNGTVRDPGGVGGKAPPADTRSSGSSGCSVTDAPVSPLARSDWWILTGFMVWLGALVQRKHRS
ncbi:MAG: Ig-like domain-containing protein [Gammaproteobacteria bacterium]